MAPRTKKILYIAIAVLVLGYAAFRLIVPPMVDKTLNKQFAFTPQPISAETLALHNSLIIMDWHADTLLWDRDFLKRSSYGQVDLPRLKEGGSSFQMLTTVTKAPPGLNLEINDDKGDDITLLTIAQGWPVRTWTSLLERALYQAERLDNIITRSEGRMRWIKSKTDLAAHKANTSNSFAVLLGTEGAHPLEGRLENLDRMYGAGFRMVALTHFFDNELGGSLHGRSKAGLTDFGRTVVGRLDELNIIIDLAHASEKMAWEVLELTNRPVVVSHTGLKGHCNTARNFDDALMKAIAAKGGLIAIGMWQHAICDPTPAGIAGAIKYGIDLVGSDHIALGSDWDGSVEMIAADALPQITQALVTLGVVEADIRKVMGDNSVNFLANWLPEN